jgi:hypothetical protein
MLWLGDLYGLIEGDFAILEGSRQVVCVAQDVASVNGRFCFTKCGPCNARHHNRVRYLRRQSGTPKETSRSRRA